MIALFRGALVAGACGAMASALGVIALLLHTIMG